MSNLKNKVRKAKARSLDSYKFETSNYVIMKNGARRDSQTGRLTSVKTAKKSSSHATTD